jgi:hypothetical protein
VAVAVKGFRRRILTVKNKKPAPRKQSKPMNLVSNGGNDDEYHEFVHPNDPTTAKRIGLAGR